MQIEGSLPNGNECERLDLVASSERKKWCGVSEALKACGTMYGGRMDIAGFR